MAALGQPAVERRIGGGHELGRLDDPPGHGDRRLARDELRLGRARRVGVGAHGLEGGGAQRIEVGHPASVIGSAAMPAAVAVLAVKCHIPVRHRLGSPAP